MHHLIVNFVIIHSFVGMFSSVVYWCDLQIRLFCSTAWIHYGICTYLTIIHTDLLLQLMTMLPLVIFFQAHISEGSKFDFQQFLSRALDKDFEVVVGIR